MAYIALISDDAPFDWTPTKEETGDPMESTFQLRIVSDDTDAELRKTHTKQVWDKKQRRTVDKLERRRSTSWRCLTTPSSAGLASKTRARVTTWRVQRL
jgi:hypothetical protein